MMIEKLSSFLQAYSLITFVGRRRKMIRMNKYVSFVVVNSFVWLWSIEWNIPTETFEYKWNESNQSYKETIEIFKIHCKKKKKTFKSINLQWIDLVSSLFEEGEEEKKKLNLNCVIFDVASCNNIARVYSLTFNRKVHLDNGLFCAFDWFYSFRFD